MAKPSFAVVTGGNRYHLHHSSSRGIGLEVCKKLSAQGIRVLFTARDSKDGEKTLSFLQKEGFQNLDFYPLDLTSPGSTQSLSSHVSQKYGNTNLALVNNAGKDKFD